jgi:hypothetical protein
MRLSGAIFFLFVDLLAMISCNLAFSKAFKEHKIRVPNYFKVLVFIIINLISISCIAEVVYIFLKSNRYIGLN